MCGHRRLSPALLGRDAVPASPPESGVRATGEGQPPVRRLTVLFDANCGFCRWVRNWLTGQAQLVPLDFLPAGSAEARHAFPYLDHPRTLRDLTVVGDGGQVYEGTPAWIVILWALRRYRRLALRLANPRLQPLAKAAVATAAGFRGVTRDETAGFGAHGGYGGDRGRPCGGACAS